MVSRRYHLFWILSALLISFLVVEVGSETLIDVCKNRKVIALGDSLTEGLYMTPAGDKYLCCHPYAGRLSQLLVGNNIEVLQTGRSGWTANQVKSDLPRHLALHVNSKALIILAGTNDLDKHTGVNHTIRDILRLHKLALNSSYSFSDPVVYTIAVTIPQASAAASIWEKDRIYINERITAFQQRCSSRVALINMDIPFNQTDPSILDMYWSKDTVHLNEKGYDQFAEVIYQTMNSFNVTNAELPSSCMDLEADD